MHSTRMRPAWATIRIGGAFGFNQVGKYGTLHAHVGILLGGNTMSSRFTQRENRSIDASQTLARASDRGIYFPLGLFRHWEIAARP